MSRLQSCTVTHDPTGGVFGPPTLLTTFNSTPNQTLRRPIKEVRHDHELKQIINEKGYARISTINPNATGEIVPSQLVRKWRRK
ncbi:preprotein translocase subunit SecD [Corchorus olitorius]|uniref:Preprotein translocase subunit SecD n=1 Tax=Corchorus olitorius TaxID=93759 RepID=A0A1R3JK81_9ROSI|nr:preprotein translocase subunit SecD [Corchorus olitorius]